MCRVDLTPAAAVLVGRLLGDLRAALAAETGCDPAEVRIGPVDFGDPAYPTESEEQR